MAKAGKKASGDGGGVKVIAANPNARRNFQIEEKVEAGISLLGTEIKSIRDSAPNLRDSYVEIDLEGTHFYAHIRNLHIAPYKHGSAWNHEPERKRQLLLKKHQLAKLFGATRQKGYTVVPLRMYFKQGWAKLELGMGKGKKLHDKRDTLKSKAIERDMAQARKRSR
jgi:SsrA-binding protein